MIEHVVDAGKLRQGAAAAAAGLAGPVLLRLALGRWPDAGEQRAFRRGMRTRYVYLPPLLRALMLVPEAQRLMRMMQRLTWVYGEGGLRPDLLQARLAEAGAVAMPDLAGNIFNAWTGPPLAFLHLEKCGGIALMHWLAELFHPDQIDPDPDRALPPHLYYRHPRGLGGETRRRPLVWGHYGLPALRRLDGDRFVFTLLREPRERIVSLYHYWRSVDPALVGPASGNFTVALAHRLDLAAFLRHDDPFLRDYLDNFYTRRLTGLHATGAEADPLAAAPEAALAAARQALAGLDFVGITERMDGSVARLARRIGAMPPASLRRANVAAENHADPTGRFRSVRRSELTPEIESDLAWLTRLDQPLYAEALARFDDAAGS